LFTTKRLQEAIKETSGHRSQEGPDEKFNLHSVNRGKGRPIRKVMGGVGKKTKKIHARENSKKKIRAKKKIKKKYSCKSCNFYLICKTCECLKNNPLYSKYSWGLTPSPAILLLINKDI